MIDEEKIERRATWAYYVVGGIVAATLFCAKLQFNMVETQNDLAALNATVAKNKQAQEETAQHYRELHAAHDIQEEHRFTALETDVSWLKTKR